METYELVEERHDKDDKSNYCATRSDDTRVRNGIKTYLMFVVHLAASVLFVVVLMEFVNGHNFRPGTPPTSILGVDVPLYQTQVNGLVSLALVIVRLLAMCCTAPLMWTVILILLEKRGMTLPEISRLSNYNVPILPRKAQGWRWFSWATLVTLLLWPPNFASPIASSSLAWIPNAPDLGTPSVMALNGPPEKPDDSFWKLRAPEWQMYSFLRAVVRSGASPSYAFNDTSARRYFALPDGLEMTNNSIISAPLPYFNMNIRWVNGTNDTWAHMVGNTSFSDYVASRNNGVSRSLGAVLILDDEPWDRINDWPSKASRFKEQRLIAVMVTQYGSSDSNKDGTPVTRDSACPENSPGFVSLPDFPRLFKEYSVDDKSWGRDCYQIGIATIEAGLFQGKDCNITLVGAREAAATCPVSRDMISVEDDWVAPVAVHMLSEIAKATVTLDYTKPWLNKTTSLNDYTTGVLRLTYHAAWSSAMELMPADTANGTWIQARPMVRASVERRKIYAWLSMQLTITVSALLVYAGLRFSSVKFVRDTTLTPLRLDLSSVTHHRLSKGLCSAAALSKDDHKLPMVKFYQPVPYSARDANEGLSSNPCCSRLVFVDKVGHEYTDHI